MPLIPEKPLIISPSLAATLGLEETVLLHILGEIQAHRAPGSTEHHSDWHNIEVQQLQTFMPFWQPVDLQRIATSLQDKGVISISSAPLTESGQLRFALAEHKTKPAGRTSTQTVPKPVQGTRLISNQWQPCEDTFRQLAQYNIPRDFAEQQIPEFVAYWRERNEPQYSWGSKFIKRVLHSWRTQESSQARKNQETSMHPAWQPSSDAVDILTRQAGININFIEDAIPEFVLYWQERGDACSTWNSRFITHIRHQWARYTATMEQDTQPKPLPANWSPSESLFDVLNLANIPRSFAERQVPEFILYWRESGQIYGSWNTRFLQQVKRQWARHCHQQQDSNNETRQVTDQPVRTRDRSLEEDLTDRSWAQ